MQVKRYSVNHKQVNEYIQVESMMVDDWSQVSVHKLSILKHTCIENLW
jgi:hypothetical protein